MRLKILLGLLFLLVSYTFLGQGTIHATIKDDGIDVVFTLRNDTSENLYLFDSYIKEEYSKDYFLHRYERKSNQFKLSFLPIAPFLTEIQSHHIRPFSVSGCHSYHFMDIRSLEKVQIRISKSAISKVDYIIDMKSLYGWSRRVVEPKKTKRHPDGYITVEFAIYDDVRRINTWPHTLMDIVKREHQKRNYRIFSITLDVNSFLIVNQGFISDTISNGEQLIKSKYRYICGSNYITTSFTEDSTYIRKQDGGITTFRAKYRYVKNPSGSINYTDGNLCDTLYQFENWLLLMDVDTCYVLMSHKHRRKTIKGFDELRKFYVEESSGDKHEESYQLADNEFISGHILFRYSNK